MSADLSEWRDGQTHDTRNVRLVARLTGHIGIVWDAQFGRRSGLIATAAEDGLVRLWNTKGSLLSTFEGHMAAVRQVVWSPDDQYLASASADGSVRVWEVRSGNSTVLGSHNDPAVSVSWSHDGLWIASAAYDRAVCIWDAITRKTHRRINLGRPAVAVAWSPTEARLLCACTDTRLRLVTLNENDPPMEVKRCAGRGGTNCVSWSNDGKVFAAGGGGRAVPLFDAGTGRRITEIQARSTSGLTNPSVGCLRFSPDPSARLIAVTCGHTTSLWRWDKRELVGFVDSDPGVGRSYAGSGGIAFHPDGTILAVRDDRSNDISLWAMESMIAPATQAPSDKIHETSVRFPRTTMPPSSATKEQGQSLQVFLCHSSQDKAFVRKLYQRLTDDGFAPWLDEENLIPGQNWQQEISKAVKMCHVVIVCLSQTSVNKEGFVQKEIRIALDVADQKPEGKIFIIPARLDEKAEVPERLSQWHWVNLFDESGYRRLLNALSTRSKELGIAPIVRMAAGAVKVHPQDEEKISESLQQLYQTSTSAMERKPGAERPPVASGIEFTPAVAGNSSNAHDSGVSSQFETVKQRETEEVSERAPTQRLNPMQQSPSWMDVWNNLYNNLEQLVFGNNHRNTVAGPQFRIKRADNNWMILIDPIKRPPKPLVTTTLEVEDKHIGKVKLTWTNADSGSRIHHFQISQGVITKIGEMAGYPGYPKPPEEPMLPEVFARYVLDPVLLP